MDVIRHLEDRHNFFLYNMWYACEYDVSWNGIIRINKKTI